MHESGLLRAAVAALVEATAGPPMRTVVLAVGPGVDVDSAAAAWQAASSRHLPREHPRRMAARSRQAPLLRLRPEYEGEPLDRARPAAAPASLLPRRPR